MAVIQRIIPQDNFKGGLDFFKELLQIVKNPAELDALFEQARRQYALTEEEKLKQTSARKFIIEAESLSEALGKREETVVASELAHTKTKKDFEQYKVSETKKLTDIRIDLTGREESHRSAQIQLENIKNKLAEQGRLMALEHQKALSKINEAMMEIEKQKQDLQTKATEVAQTKAQQEKRNAEMLRLITGE